MLSHSRQLYLLAMHLCNWAQQPNRSGCRAIKHVDRWAMVACTRIYELEHPSDSSRSTERNNQRIKAEG